MKKLVALCSIAVLCLCCLTSCGFFTPTIERFIPDEQIMSVEIKTTNYEMGIDEISEKYILTDEQSDEIKTLLNEIAYAQRYNILQEKWTYFNDVQYIFIFETQKVCLSENHIYIYDSNDTLIKHVEFNSSTFNDYREKINEVLKSNDEACEHIWDDGIEVEGGNDAYLMEYTCTICGEKDQQIIFIIPPNNDILYISAYPQDFEYNGKHYHLVQGDGLKTTATQKEVGGLLGYIIREEDISSFSQEYPNVDYVIDNSIYDYYEGNRAAFYSLKAYPDLSIICVRQLGEYVLYQEEQN